MSNTLKICIFILPLTLLGCKAQPIHDSLKYKHIMIPIVTRNFEKFDSIKFNNSKKENPYVLREFLSDGTYIEMTSSNSGKYYLETPPNSYFMISKTYYSNGNIKAKGLGFNGDAFQKGVWYEFDEKGTLVKETDYDADYKFRFEDILAFCEREGIEVKKGPILQSTGYHTQITRHHSPILGKRTWVIRWLKKPDLIEEISLDGDTGKVLKRKDIEYINN